MVGEGLSDLVVHIRIRTKIQSHRRREGEREKIREREREREIERHIPGLGDCDPIAVMTNISRIDDDPARRRPSYRRQHNEERERERSIATAFSQKHFLEVDQCEIDFPFSLNGTAYLPFPLVSANLIDPSSIGLRMTFLFFLWRPIVRRQELRQLV